MAYLKEEIKAGVIIFSALIILSAFTILIGGSGLFEKFDVYYVKMMNAAGLESGSQVKLGGVRVGSVKDIEVPDKPGEPITITIGIKRGTPLYKGTLALITQIGFVGDIYLLLAIEDTKATEDKKLERINVGEVIPSVEGKDLRVLMAKAGEISESLEALIKNIDRLFSQSNVKDIEKLVKEVTLVLDEVKGILKDNKGGISRLIARASETIEKAGNTVSAIEETARSVDKTSESIERAVDLQSQNMTGLLNRLAETTEDLQEVLQEIKNKPWSIIYKERRRNDQ